MRWLVSSPALAVGLKKRNYARHLQETYLRLFSLNCKYVGDVLLSSMLMKPLHTSNKSEAAAVKKQTVITLHLAVLRRGLKCIYWRYSYSSPFLLLLLQVDLVQLKYAVNKVCTDGVWIRLFLF